MYYRYRILLRNGSKNPPVICSLFGLWISLNLLSFLSIPPQLWRKDKSEPWPILLAFAAVCDMSLNNSYHIITKIFFASQSLESAKQSNPEHTHSFVLPFFNWLTEYFYNPSQHIIPIALFCPVFIFISYDIGQSSYGMTICGNLRAETVHACEYWS